MPHDSDATITAGKNKLANICIFGQIKTSDLMREIAGQMPNNAKQLSRDLIAAAARVLRPDTTPELVRDILHYRSRKVRCLFKEWKSGKLDTPLEQRLIECEKALLNTLELGANLSNSFLEMPEINARSLDILSQMHLYIMDANFRTLLIPTLPALVSDPRHANETAEQKETKSESVEIEVKNGDQESDGDSVHASSSSFEDQCCAVMSEQTSAQMFNLNYPEQLQAILLNSSNAMHDQIKSTSLVDLNNRRSSVINGTIVNNSSLNKGPASIIAHNSTKTLAGRKRKFEETQLEIFEMKRELIRLQQVAFERQIQIADEVVGMLKEMRGWMELQKRSSTMITSTPLPQLNPLSNTINNYPLISNQLSTNLNTLSSLLASATNVTSPQFI